MHEGSKRLYELKEMHFGRLLILLHGMNLHATQRCDKRQYSSTAVRFPIVNDISNLHIITSSDFSRAYAHARTRKGIKAPATILPAKKPYFWIGHCLTVFRWQAGGSRGQRLSLDSSRAGRTCLTCCYPATHFLSPPTQPCLSG